MRGTPQRKCVGPPVLTGMDSIIMKCSLDDLDIIMSYDVWKLNINMPHDTMPLFILNAAIHMMPNMAFLITISLITTSYYAKKSVITIIETETNHRVSWSLKVSSSWSRRILPWDGSLSMFHVPPKMVIIFWFSIAMLNYQRRNVHIMSNR